mmetsp:Transcript_61118/g.117791  ORF Transcript_61118/g.117791 Transcript_61118/m.117791 type:complete len:136 (+) Transcript_61118:779-1186(+)
MCPLTEAKGHLLHDDLHAADPVWPAQHSGSETFDQHSRPTSRNVLATTARSSAQGISRAIGRVPLQKQRAGRCNSGGKACDRLCNASHSLYNGPHNRLVKLLRFRRHQGKWHIGAVGALEVHRGHCLTVEHQCMV